MRRVLALASLSLGVLAVAGIVGARAAPKAHVMKARADQSGPKVGATIFLDPPYDRMQFAPPPPGVQPALTSSEALTASGLEAPSNATVQLGSYTAAAGEGTYRWQNQLAWGFSWPQCAPLQHDYGPETHVPCTLWLFIDADTGQMLEQAWQQ